MNAETLATNGVVGESTPALLNVDGLTMRFGGIIALNNVSFTVQPHSITALIGPNGAGKTTVFNCVTGFYKATEGKLSLNAGGKQTDLRKVLGERFQWSDYVNPKAFGERLYYKAFGGSHRVALAGVARTFQNIRLFRELTVVENLLVAQHIHLDRNLIRGTLRTKGYRASERKALETAYHWLDVMNLTEDANRLAGELPYGNQRRLEIARAMCTEPKLICLDEPAAGLNPRETEDLSKLIRKLRDEHKVTVLLIEHDMGLVMSISEHIVVLDYGQVIACGSPKEIETNPKVLAAYLGTEAEEVVS
ncbi:ABC transporter ATP-binding protein [Thiolinea disciformis]|uniref:ABC transporter ATP-binding protein n=1 Tax=Thiolinea disciformis TaxID=125614 RepID=UPI0003729B12|nr:ATP-binding cassette domain-containing protein [Thiolinea disciformis]